MSEEILKQSLHDIRGALAALYNFANHLEKHDKVKPNMVLMHSTPTGLQQ